MADLFMFGRMVLGTQQCVRPNGNDRIRFSFTSRDFGVAAVLLEAVRTFYKVKRSMVRKHGGTAGFFAYECGRVSL